MQSKRFQVEELRWRIAALDEMQLGLDENVRQLDGAIDRERLRSGDSAIARLAMPQFMQAIEERRRNIEKTRADLERDRRVLEAQLITVLQEIRAVETAEEHRKRRAGEASATVVEFRRTQSLLRRNLRRHAVQ